MPYLDYKDCRDDELYRQFLRIFKITRGAKTAYIYNAVIKSTASQFFIGEEKAIRNLKKLVNGKMDISRKVKRQMYSDLMEKVVKVQQEKPGISFSEAVREAIYTEAPQFYISPRLARKIISQKRKEAFYKIKKKSKETEE